MSMYREKHENGVKQLILGLLPPLLRRFFQRLAERLRVSLGRISYQRRKRVWNSRQSASPPLLHALDRELLIELWNDSILCEYIYLGGYEERELSFVKRYLQEGDIFIDIGGNIGLYTLIAAKCVGMDGMVYAFEPVQSTFDRLVRNVRRNKLKNVDCRRCAISSSQGVLSINYAPAGRDAWNSLSLEVGTGESEQDTVQSVTLDSFWLSDLKGRRVKLIKVDVEGWEVHVLRGGESLLSSPNAPTLLIEFNDENLMTAGVTGAELFICLEKLGYSMLEFSDTVPTLLIPAVRREVYDYQNLVATKDSEMRQHFCHNTTIAT